MAAELLEDRALLSVTAADDIGNMTNHDQPLTIDVLFNDSASGSYDENMNYTPPGTLSATAISIPTNGAVTTNSDGTLTYTPNANWAGTDQFTYKATDGNETTVDPVLVTIIVMNSAPMAVDDTGIMVGHNQTFSSGAPGILGNDSGLDGDPLTITIVADPQHGSVTVYSDGSFDFIPDGVYVGDDVFTYKLSDGIDDGVNDTEAQVTIQIGNSMPVAYDDSYTVLHDQVLTVTGLGLLCNDSDPDGDLLTATLINGVSNGVLAFNSNGSFTYTPSDDFAGGDSFTYEVSDGFGGTSTATVSINVSNTAPCAVDDEFSTYDDTLDITDDVLANDYDLDMDTLMVSLVSGPNNGILSLSSVGTFTYNAADDFFGTDTFTYSVFDGFAYAFATVILKGSSLRIRVPNSSTGKLGDYTNNETQLTVWVGDLVDLRAQFQGDSTPPDGTFEWSITKKAVDGYAASVARGEIDPLTAEERKVQEIDFHFVEGGLTKVVVTFTPANGTPAVSKWVKIFITRPQVTFTATMQPVTVSEPYTGWYSELQDNLDIRLGNWNTPTSEQTEEGIVFNVPQQPSFGEYFLIQTISTSQQVEFFNGTRRVRGGSGLDGSYPSNDRDSPGGNVPDNVRISTSNMTFSTCLMFKHDKEGAIPVPLQVINWEFGFSAEQTDPDDLNGDGIRWTVTHNASKSNAVDTTDHPQWTQNARDLTWLEDL